MSKIINKTQYVANDGSRISIVYRGLGDLRPTEYNPKGMTPKEENDLTESIKKYGLTDPLIINTFEGREGIIIGGHQRYRIAKDLGITEVPCIEKYLNEDDEKELNLRLTKNTGHIEEALLSINFERDLLERVGFSIEDIGEVASEFEQQFNAIDNASCVYPIVPKFNEKYDCAIIISKNETDTAFMETVLGISKAQSYKNQRTGKAMVIDVEQLRQKWEAR